ncbi:seizure 6-like protein 2 [Porites lutea]|uniref:seizure 6-like protein 2 n=1 Tax=Porites lutea TaxID=51062 RepID=UPI003CC62B77
MPKVPCLRLELYGCTAPASCSDPGIPYQGKRIDHDFHHGSTVTFTCPRDHVMEGAAAIKCTDGRWNSTKPSCKAPCVEPTDPRHGWKVNRDFRHGRSVRFYCFSGYQRVGAASITCNDGNWDGWVPLCKVKAGYASHNQGNMLYHPARLRMTLDCSIVAKEIAMESGFFVGGRRQTLLCSCK